MPLLNLHCDSCPARQEGPLDTLPCSQINAAKVANTYSRGQVIFYEGNPAFGMYIVASGLVKTYTINSDGKVQILHLSKAGDFLGYRAVLSDQTFGSTAEAIGDAVVCFVDKAAIFEFIANDNEVARGFLNRMAGDLRRTQHLLTDIAHSSVRERVACLLLDLGNDFGEDTPKGRNLTINLSREELAACVGTSTESLVRVLSDFSKDALISKSGHSLNLLNIKELERISAHH